MRKKYPDSNIDPDTAESNTTESHSSERAMDRTTKITTSYVFRAPKPHKMAIYLVLLCIIAGFIINFDINNISDNFSGDKLYRNILVFGLFLIGLPALLSAIFSTPAAELLGGVFYYRRSFLLAFSAAGALVCVLIIARIVSAFVELDMSVVLVFAYALIFSVRHSVLLSTSNHRHLCSLPASISQTLFGFGILCTVPNSFFTCSEQMLVYMFWFTIVFLVTTWLWLFIVTRPFKRNFGTNGLLLMKHAMTQFTDDPKMGLDIEREFFSKIGTSTSVRVGTVAIKPMKGKWKGKPNKPKTLWVIPSLHPGPFGLLGGSNLPKKIYEQLKNVTKNLMVFHGSATHEYNPTATAECDKLALAIKKLVERTEYSDTTSTFQKVTLDSIGNNKKISKQDPSGLSVCAQRFGNGNVYIHTSSPNPTDDIDYPTGEAVVQKAQNQTGAKALFIDAHNCLEPGTGQVYFGSEKANNILKLVTSVNRELQDAEYGNIECGYADHNRYSKEQGLGPMGIQVMVVRCKSEDGKEKNTAYILLDGNNVVCGLREKIIAQVADLVDNAEVFTTDNHVVNTTMGGYNPVGLKLGHDEIIGSIKKLLKKAINDCEPCEVGVNSTLVKNVNILGQNTPLRLSATINATISVMKSSLVACQGLALTTCWMLALFL